MGIGIVIKNEFIRSLRYKKKLLLGLLIPVISIIAAISINSFMKPTINIGVINNSIDTIYEEFKSEATSIDGLKVSEANEESINTDMILAKYSAIIKFNKDKSFEVNCLDNEFKANIEKIMDEYFINGELNGFKDVLLILENENMTVAERSVCFILLTLIVSCTLSTCNLIKDKDDGTLKRFSLSANKISSYILGVYIYNLLNTVMQIVIVVSILTIMPVEIGITGIELLAIGLIIAIITSGLSIFIVTLCKSELQASVVSSVVALIMSLLGGAFLPLDKMPTVLQYISNFTITKWLVELVENIQLWGLSINVLIIMMVILVASLFMSIFSCILGRRKFI
ncbi:MAG: ABC transporter permease [Clostridium sp.]